MIKSKLIKIIDDFFKAIYCLESFPYPLNQKTVDIHIINKVQMKEKEIKKLQDDIQKMYTMNDFIPIVPPKDSKVYKCQHDKIYKDIKKLSQIILLLKEMKLEISIPILEKVLNKKIEEDIDIDEDDIIKFDQKMKLFDYLILKKQREDYIEELKIRVKNINKMNDIINKRKKEVSELKNKPSYELLYNIGQVEKITRDYFIKKITIFIMNFRKEFKELKLTKEVNKLKDNKFNWKLLSNNEIEKIIDFICINTKDQLVKIYDANLEQLILKLYKIKEQTENINI
jgi:hypothetical protein